MFGIVKAKNAEGKQKLPGPKAIPDVVGRYIIEKEKADPVWTWIDSKAVIYPLEKGAAYCRVYDPNKVKGVRDWTSLDNHPALIVWEGYYNEETRECRSEKFKVPSAQSPSTK